jgi:hypothetical protein
MRYFVFDKQGNLKGAERIRGEWALVYTNCEADYRKVLEKIDAKVFGTTSFMGAFSPEGFVDGAILLAEDGDNIKASYRLVETKENNARERAKEAVEEIRGELGGNPDVILMHATPGYEERILEGIYDVFGDNIRVFGGSAGDNDLTGKWKLFDKGKEINEGVLLVGFKNPRGIFGAFVSGYFPTEYKGKITKAKGRVIYEIDGRPAAEVYNEWTKGLISDYIDKGGVILAQTTLYPLARVVGQAVGIPLYLLSHPHMVIKEDKAISFFTEFEEGEEVLLLRGSKEGLISRTEDVARRALRGHTGPLKGGILIYCAGCVLNVMDSLGEIVKSYKKAVGNIPFIGAATFGEQGAFFIEKRKNRHGNLMCDTLIFG